MRILTTILFLTVFVLPSFGVWMRVAHSDSIESNLKVDSIVTIYLSDSRWSKVKSEYNENGKKVREFLDNYHPHDGLRHLRYPREKSEFTYDVNNRLIEKREVCYDYQNKKYVNAAKTVYKYDIHGNKEAEYNNTYFYNNKWKRKEKVTTKEKWKYNYDAKGNVIEIIDYNKYKKKWSVRNRHVYTYDTKGNTLKETEYLRLYCWEKHSYLKIEYKKTESFYNIYGKKEKTFSYSWNPDKKDIDTINIYTRKYDELLNVTQTESYYYSKGEWEGNVKTNFIYNIEEKPKETISYLWNKETKDWYKSWKTIYTYDDNGNLLEETEYCIRLETDDVHSYPVSKQTTYVYNEKGEMTARSKIIYRNDYETKEWALLGREEYELKGDTAVENYYCLDAKMCECCGQTFPYRTDTYYFSTEKQQ